MLQVSDAAAQAVKAVMDEKDLTSPVRVHLAQGCGGAQLGLVIDDERQGDKTVEVGGQTYLVNGDLAELAGELNLDYIDDERGKGFVITSEKPIEMEGGCGSGCSCGC